MARRFAVAGALWILLGAGGAAAAAAAETAPLRADHAAFLADAAALISPAEREAFLALGRDYQRDRFITRFWQVRDPFPETARNEFRVAWEARVAAARARYEDLEDGRSHVLLRVGEPSRIDRPGCRALLKPIEIWTYEGSAAQHGEFTVLFVQRQGNPKGKFQIWRQIEGLQALAEWASPTGSESEGLAQRIANECASGSDVLGAAVSAVDWDRVEDSAQLLPKPSAEWLTTFTSRSTDVPADAPPLAAAVGVRFPGRHQSRTVVEATIAVDPAAAIAGPTGGYGFVLDGEVLLRGEYFDGFRYRFDLPAAKPGVGASALPMVVERYLRPGEYVLVLRVEDLNGHRFFRHEAPLAVPRVEPAAAVALAAAGVGAAAPAASMAPTPATPADAAESSDHTVKLMSPSNELKTGRVRIEAVADGDGIATVVFSLDGRRVLTKARPPWSVELDVGRQPRTHQVRAVAMDAGGRELASDELLLNAGPHSFRVRLLQPQRGQRYTGTLRAEAAVAVPIGETLDRVEFYLNEERVATLYQPPYVQPIALPADGAVSYVRAVAVLADGNSAEAVTFVNAPDYAVEVAVDLVEIYATVVDRRGRPVEGLERADFTVREDGQDQEILRFETVRDLPIRAAVVLDTSSSMLEELGDVTRAALRFFDEVVTPRDRAAIVTFADRPALASPFTNNAEVLAGSVAALTADGETALYDAVVYTLHYFSGMRGKRAMVLLSDGEDTSSKYAFSEALDFARRTGVAIYTIGLNLPQKAVDARAKMGRLAEETGGRSFSIQSVNELERVYREIEAELRSQYLMAYQSPQDEPTRYRAVEVLLARPGLEAKTIRGYYP